MHFWDIPARESVSRARAMCTVPRCRVGRAWRSALEEIGRERTGPRHARAIAALPALRLTNPPKKRSADSAEIKFLLIGNEDHIQVCVARKQV